MTGLPGSALFYVGLSWVLFTHGRRRREHQLRWGLAGYWALGAVFEARAYFWNPEALGRQLSMVASTPSPEFVTAPVYLAARWATHVPLMTDALLGGIFLGLAVLTLVSRAGDSAWMGISLAVLFVLWWIGMDFGVLGGVGTDPNTAPLAALVRYGYGRDWRRDRGRLTLVLQAPVQLFVRGGQERRHAH